MDERIQKYEEKMKKTLGSLEAEPVSYTHPPGIYVPGFGGVRIEDMVVVTEDGCRNLAHSPKELIEVPVEN